MFRITVRGVSAMGESEDSNIVSVPAGSDSDDSSSPEPPDDDSEDSDKDPDSSEDQGASGNNNNGKHTLSGLQCSVMFSDSWDKIGVTGHNIKFFPKKIKRHNRECRCFAGLVELCKKNPIRIHLRKYLQN